MSSASVILVKSSGADGTLKQGDGHHVSKNLMFNFIYIYIYMRLCVCVCIHVSLMSLVPDVPENIRDITCLKL